MLAFVFIRYGTNRAIILGILKDDETSVNWQSLEEAEKVAGVSPAQKTPLLQSLLAAIFQLKQG